MNHLFVCLFLLLSSLTPSLSYGITANVDINEDESGKSFILIDEGTDLELTCDATDGHHEWDLPDNTDVKGFSEEDQAKRVRSFLGHDIAEQKLSISSAKVWDTGLYSCTYEGHSKDDVYVFVRGSHFFIKSIVNGFHVGDEFTVPCRSSWPPLEEEGKVELLVEHELWKEASKHYDPRVGFKITPKLMLRKHGDAGRAFQCKYKEETINFFLQEKRETEEDESAYNISLVQNTEFPYYTGSLNVSCQLEGPNVSALRMVHKVHIDCPRCRERDEHGNKIDMSHKMRFRNNDELRNETIIEKLSPQDAGVYSCQWYMEKDGQGFELMKEIQQTIQISNTMEQIKLINRTQGRGGPKGYIEVEEGNDLKIFGVFRTFPDDKTIYSSRWKRLYTRAHKGIDESEILINDDQRNITTEWIHDDLNNRTDVYEKLVITGMTQELSGLYSLEVSVNQVTTRREDFEVRVKGRKMVPRIEVASQDKWILFDQSYYKFGSALRVICFVEGLPKPEVRLLTRKLDPLTEWDGVEGAEAIEGTFSKGYILNITANDDVEYKCEGRRQGKGQAVVADSKKVRVTDSVTEVNIAWHKPADASAHEDKDTIYEGDKIELECIVPKDDHVTMEWQFDKERANLPESTTVAAHSKHLIATIEKATATHSGQYTCKVSDKENHAMNFTRTLEVTKKTKPFLRGAPIEQNVILNYGNSTDLTCPMDGTPEPSFKWLKDGVEITDHSAISHKGQRLHFPRAAVIDEGTYTCLATNRAGTTELVYKMKVKGAPKTLSGISIFFLVFAFIVLVGCLIAAVLLYIRQRKRAKEQARSLQVLYEQLMRGDNSDAPPLPMHGKVPMEMRVRQTAYNSKYEIDMKNLVLEGTLGSGQFGSVRKGRLTRGAPVSDAAAYRGPALTVAVKAPRNGSNPEDQKALIDELKILIAIDNLEETKHPNVLSLVGAVTKNMKDGQLFVVFEMCENGDLKTFLQRYKSDLKDKFYNELRENKKPATTDDDYLVPNNQQSVLYASQLDGDDAVGQEERDRLLGDPKSLSTSDLISFSMQIASGMDFLSGVPCIHRDLAARNCLLNSAKVVKIADFGMAKNEDKGYYRMNKTNVMVPYRWMAPESMEDHTFTVESDVWSYGIVLYEIFTLGSQPYPGVPNNNLHEHLKSGNRNGRPELCHPDIYNMMLQTWDKDVHMRPSFGQCSHLMRLQLRAANKETLDATDAEILRNTRQIAQFDQFRGPRSTAVIDQDELAHLLADQRSPVSHVEEEETGERIYIKELRR